MIADHAHLTDPGAARQARIRLISDGVVASYIRDIARSEPTTQTATFASGGADSPRRSNR